MQSAIIGSLMQPQDSSKIDTIVNLIKILNLHIHNVIMNNSQNKNPKLTPQLARQADLKSKAYNRAFMTELDKCISQYVRRNVRDMRYVKISLSPLFFRVIRKRVDDDDFLRFESALYGVKFVFVNLIKECFVHVEFYRIASGSKVSTLALRKLESTFMHELNVKISDGNATLQMLQNEGRAALQQIGKVMQGQKCGICHKYMVYNAEYKVFLPPTVKEYEDVKGNSDKKERNWKYLHEGCL